MIYDVEDNFIRYLESNDLRERVEELISNRRSEIKTLSDYLRNISPYGYVDRLGAWRNMAEGHNFWSRHNEKWRYICSNNIEVAPTGIKSIW